MNKLFAKYWLFTIGSCVALFWATYFGIPQLIWHHDQSYVTSILAGLYVTCVVAMARWTYRLNETNFDEIEFQYDYAMKVAVLAPQIGLVGTVIGLAILLMGDVKIGADMAAIAVALGKMPSAIGTSLFSTAIGVGVKVLIEAQLFPIEKEIERHKQVKW